MHIIVLHRATVGAVAVEYFDEFCGYFLGVVDVDGLGRYSLGLPVEEVCGGGEVGGDKVAGAPRLHASHVAQHVAWKINLTINRLGTPQLSATDTYTRF